jgi:glycosyltransferase involved in cell wall biosynthesis
MRILLVNVFHEKVGGAEVYLHLLRDALVARGHAVALYAGSGRHEIDTPLERVVKRKEWDPQRLVSDPQLDATFGAFARAFRPDLVHAHNLWAFPADFVLALRGAGVPIVQTVHDYSLLCPNSWCVRGDGTVCAGGPGEQCFRHDCQRNAPFDARTVHAARLRFELMRACVDSFLCPSAFLAEHMRAHGFERARELPYFADAAASLPTPPGYAERTRGQVLYVGRLVPEKGVEYLVRALPRLQQLVPEARLCLVGGGTEEARLKQLARELGVADVADFRGRVPHQQVQQHFHSALVQVLPSIWCENSPLTTYESFQAGLPMVASDIAGLPNLVRDTGAGLLARPRDPRDFADKIAHLLTRREDWERHARAATAALARYAEEFHMAELEGEYRASLARGPRAFEAPFSDDLLAAVRRQSEQFANVEQWALGLHDHVQHLERRIAELGGKPPPPEPVLGQGTGDRGPLVFVLDRHSALGKAALLAKKLKRRLRP